jgi:hypothetical protein
MKFHPESVLSSFEYITPDMVQEAVSAAATAVYGDCSDVGEYHAAVRVPDIRYVSGWRNFSDGTHTEDHKAEAERRATAYAGFHSEPGTARHRSGLLVAVSADEPDTELSLARRVIAKLVVMARAAEREALARPTGFEETASIAA